MVIEAILEAVRVHNGKMLSTEESLQEQRYVDRSHVEATALLEVVRATRARCLGGLGACLDGLRPSDMATRLCFVDRSNVDRSIPGGRSSSWDGLRSLLRRPGALSGRPGSLGSLPGRPGRHF